MSVSTKTSEVCFSARAYAKLNLGLRILDKRADGYHGIITVMQGIDLFDMLSFFPRTSGMEVLCPNFPSLQGPENLVWKAAEVFMDSFGIRNGVKVVIRKSIPLGAGLGGGSSDAAVTLKALNLIWKTNAGYEELSRLASKLGSDVPFFLRTGTAIACGRGEELCYIDAPADVSYIVLYPEFRIDTGWAYGEWDRGKMRLTCSDNYVKLLTSSKSGGRLGKDIYKEIWNDFEPLVFERYPVLSSLKDKLFSSGAIAASLSGSGSAVYGVFEGRETAGEVLESFMLTEIKAFVCCPLVQWQDSGLWSR